MSWKLNCLVLCKCPCHEPKESYSSKSIFWFTYYYSAFSLYECLFWSDMIYRRFSRSTESASPDITKGTATHVIHLIKCSYNPFNLFWLCDHKSSSQVLKKRETSAISFDRQDRCWWVCGEPCCSQISSRMGSGISNKQISKGVEAFQDQRFWQGAVPGLDSTGYAACVVAWLIWRKKTTTHKFSVFHCLTRLKSFLFFDLLSLLTTTKGRIISIIIFTIHMSKIEKYCLNLMGGICHLRF